MKAQPPQNPLQALDKHRATLMGSFQQLQKAQVKGQAMQQALAKLEQLGEAVTSDDVVKSVGRLVANGTVDARQIAVALTTMPQSGPALAEWISQHLQSGQMALQHVQALQEETRSQLLNASFTGLMAHAGAAARQPPQEAQPEEPPTALQSAPGLAGPVGNA